MPKSEPQVGWWIWPLIIFEAVFSMAIYLIPIALTLIPLYIYGYSDLAVDYKLKVLAGFFCAGLIGNLFLVGRQKKNALYQIAWSFYVGAILGAVVLLRAWGNDARVEWLLKPMLFYLSYLAVLFVFIHFFKVKFRFFDVPSQKKRTKPYSERTLKTIEKNKRGRSAWNLLNPILLFFYFWLFFFKLDGLTFGFKAARWFIPREASVIIFPDEGPSSLVWPGFFVLGSFLAAIPVLLILVNLTEYLIPWARRAFERDAEDRVNLSFRSANKALLGGVKWMTLPLLPFVVFGLMRFYYLDPLGVHLFRFPLKTVDYPWDKIQWVRFKARANNESPTLKARYSLKLPTEQILEVHEDFLEGVTDKDILRSYVQISHGLKNAPKGSVQTDISPQGLEALKRELGGQTKDVITNTE